MAFLSRQYARGFRFMKDHRASMYLLHHLFQDGPSK
jgi:hypothetical protein